MKTWLLEEMTHGLERMYLCKLKFCPAAESLPGLIQEWCRSASRTNLSNTTEDIARIRTAFDVIIDTCEEWPPVAVFHKSLPPRKAQAQLPEYVTGKISDEVARENLRQIHKLIGLTTASSEVN